MGKSERHKMPVDLAEVTRFSIRQRPNKATVAQFGKPMAKSTQVDKFLDSLPGFLKASDLKAFIEHVVKARAGGKPFHLMMGAHPIKVGLSPILIDLIQRDIVTGLSFNGAGLIHDLEVAFFGGTSEDVQAGLTDGSFGMARETGEMFGVICRLAHDRQIGLGEACGYFIQNSRAPFRKESLFAAAASRSMPATVHIGVGTDIVCQHPEYDGAAAGEASHHDFRILAAVCADLDRGGVLANIGSAVILPEVFLKALTVARNLHKGTSRLVTANFDMIEHYRPRVNVVTRPTQGTGTGYSFVGHHEIMIPLLAWALKSRLA
jgi:hypothetical protein